MQLFERSWLFSPFHNHSGTRVVFMPSRGYGCRRQQTFAIKPAVKNRNNWTKVSAIRSYELAPQGRQPGGHISACGFFALARDLQKNLHPFFTL
jgi:hypothetical protein